MRPDRGHIIFGLVITGLLAKGCIEPFEAETLTFESALVVEATITNELKEQEIKLSRSFAFEDEGPQPERSAKVRVLDDTGSEMVFLESAPGVYRSEFEFAAQPDRQYHLEITGANGKSYISDPVKMSPEAILEEVYAERTTNEDGVEGIAIRVNASSPAENARNYRYTYEETYKIIAPKWTDKDLIVDPYPEARCMVLVVRRDSEERVCYGQQESNNIILKSTSGLTEDRINDFRVRFIRRDNYIISYRYSILVTQFVQSTAAYNYYESLQEFSGNESLLSETQPGFLQGNVASKEDKSEKVLGFFDVASAQRKRIFFNYDDYFPGEPLPPYADACPEFAPPLFGLVAGGEPPCVLQHWVENNEVRYVRENNGPDIVEPRGPYVIVPRVCGDCTVLGKVEVPDFWIE